jgi:hypothetical protein
VKLAGHGSNFINSACAFWVNSSGNQSGEQAIVPALENNWRTEELLTTVALVRLVNYELTYLAVLFK